MSKWSEVTYSMLQEDKYNGLLPSVIGTWSAAHEAFAQHLTLACMKLDYKFETHPLLGSPGYFALFLMCPHGVSWIQHMSITSGEWMQGVYMASSLLDGMVNQCKQHVPKSKGTPALPSGTTMVEQSKWSPGVPNQPQGWPGAHPSLSSPPSVIEQLIDVCPGLASVRRPCPEAKPIDECDDEGLCNGCHSTEPEALTSLIPHINDVHKWSREKIAAWLDIIAIDDPDVDLTIRPKPKKETVNEQPSIGPSEEQKQAIVQAYGSVTLDGISSPGTEVEEYIY